MPATTAFHRTAHDKFWNINLQLDEGCDRVRSQESDHEKGPATNECNGISRQKSFFWFCFKTFYRRSDVLRVKMCFALETLMEVFCCCQVGHETWPVFPHSEGGICGDTQLKPACVYVVLLSLQRLWNEQQQWVSQTPKQVSNIRLRRRRGKEHIFPHVFLFLCMSYILAYPLQKYLKIFLKIRAKRYIFRKESGYFQKGSWVC